MRIVVGTEVNAPIERVFDFVTHPDNLRAYLVGITRWDVEGDRATGLGARYAMRMKVRSAEVGGLVEVVEYDPPREFAWTGVMGIDQRGRFRLRPRGGGRTHVELRFAYSTPGGLLGWVAERVSGPIIRGNLERSMVALRAQAELSLAGRTR